MGEEGAVKVMSDTPTSGDHDQVHGEKPDSDTVRELTLAHKVVRAMSPNLLRRHSTFVEATVAIMAVSALIIAARAINQRREQGMRNPAEILGSISREDLSRVARSVLDSVRGRVIIPGRKEPEEERDD